MSWLSVWTATWNALRKVPSWAYIATLLSGIVATHLATDQRRVDAAYARGRAQTLQGAHFDSVMVKTITDARKAAAAHTDTVLRVVTRQVRRVDSIAIRIPDTLRIAYPVVDTLVIESKALAVAVDSLTRTLTAERNATALLVSTLQRSVTDARLETARLEAEAIALRKRPTRFRAFGYAVASAGAGFALGHK